MSESQRAGHILTSDGWVDGWVEFDSHILSIEEGEVPADAPNIIPGFVDLHVPGGGGAGVEPADALLIVAQRTRHTGLHLRVKHAAVTHGEGATENLVTRRHRTHERRRRDESGARGSVNAEGDVLVVVSGGVALSVLPHVARPVAHHLAPGVASREEFKSSRVQGRVQPWSREYGGRKFEVRRMCVERRVRVQISV